MRIKINEHNISLLYNLPDNTESLFCCCLGLNFLPELKHLTKLYELICYGNNIKVIPELPPSIEYVMCWGNKIEELPDFTHCDNLRELWCQHNNIKKIPDLRKCYKLNIFNIKENKIDENIMKYLNPRIPCVYQFQDMDKNHVFDEPIIQPRRLTCWQTIKKIVLCLDYEVLN